ncbi:MAG: peptidase dimerization domain-containing protein [Acidimicrobiia bacterium]
MAHLAAVRAWLRTAGELVQREGAGGGRGGDRLARPRRSSRPMPPSCSPTSCSSPTPATGQSGTPGLTYSLRGLVSVDVTRWRGTDSPLHSGMAGGAVPGPVLALAAVLASLVDEHGDAAFDGWDDYEAPGADEQAHRSAARRRRRPAWGMHDGVGFAGDRPCHCSSGCGRVRSSP